MKSSRLSETARKARRQDIMDKRKAALKSIKYVITPAEVKAKRGKVYPRQSDRQAQRYGAL